jgi:hypothetical protein
MSNPSPLQCFIAGHNLGYVGSYFDQVLLAAEVERSTQPKAKEHTKNMITNLQRVAPNFVQRLREIAQVAAHCGFPKRDLPAHPAEYKIWAPRIHMDFLEIWDIDDLHGWLFGHAYALGELRNLLIVLLVGMDLQVNFSIDSSQRFPSMLKRGQEILSRYEHSALRLEGSTHFDYFYSESLQHVPIFHDLLRMQDEAVPFFAKTQKLLSSFAKIEKSALEDWLGALK